MIRGELLVAPVLMLFVGIWLIVADQGTAGAIVIVVAVALVAASIVRDLRRERRRRRRRI